MNIATKKPLHSQSKLILKFDNLPISGTLFCISGFKLHNSELPDQLPVFIGQLSTIIYYHLNNATLMFKEIEVIVITSLGIKPTKADWEMARRKQKCGEHNFRP